jgi:hypothetical protein
MYVYSTYIYIWHSCAMQAFATIYDLHLTSFFIRASVLLLIFKDSPALRSLDAY